MIERYQKGETGNNTVKVKENPWLRNKWILQKVKWNKVKVKKNSFLRKEQLQPVRNEASLQADGTYTTNSRFDFFFGIYELIISFNNYHICFKYHICRMIHDICLMIFISFPDSNFLIIQNLIIYHSLLPPKLQRRGLVF